MNNKRTLIIMHATMEIGGVQQNFVELIRYATVSGHRVIWLYKKPMRLAKAYVDISDKVECVDYFFDSSLELKCPSLYVGEGESVVWLTSTPRDMHLTLGYCNNNKELDITPLYIVSNTKGRYNYIENYYWGPLKSIIFSKFKQIVNTWHEHNLIRYFDINHFFTYKAIYGVDHEQPNDLVWKNINGLPKLNQNILEARTLRSVFNIITVTRFDFPHKQYLLGLIKDYGALKLKYPHIKLHIIGYGQDEDRVKEVINKLPIIAQKDVILYGQKSEQEIMSIMQLMHLNISVAACVGLGAKCGVLSIPARNFCENECEVYGYLPNSQKMTTSTDSGERAIRYIEDVIRMDRHEYYEKCLDSYQAYDIKEIDPDFILRQYAQINNLSFEYKFNNFFTFFHRSSDYFWKIGNIFSKLITRV